MIKVNDIQVTDADLKEYRERGYWTTPKLLQDDQIAADELPRQVERRVDRSAVVEDIAGHVEASGDVSLYGRSRSRRLRRRLVYEHIQVHRLGLVKAVISTRPCRGHRLQQ